MADYSNAPSCPVESEITATLSRPLGTGLTHADTHYRQFAGIADGSRTASRFLDFGMLSTFPKTFLRETEAVVICLVS